MSHYEQDFLAEYKVCIKNIFMKVWMIFHLIVIDLIFLKIIHLKEAKLANHFNEIKLRLEMAYF